MDGGAGAVRSRELINFAEDFVLRLFPPGGRVCVCARHNTAAISPARLLCLSLFVVHALCFCILGPEGSAMQWI